MTDSSGDETLQGALLRPPIRGAALTSGNSADGLGVLMSAPSPPIMGDRVR